VKGAPLGNGPSGDGGVDGGHEADGFGQGDDHFLIVVQVFDGEAAFAAVFDPFFGDLIAADVKLPDLRRNAFEGLTGRKMGTVPRRRCRWDCPLLPLSLGLSPFSRLCPHC